MIKKKKCTQNGRVYKFILFCFKNKERKNPFRQNIKSIQKTKKTKKMPTEYNNRKMVQIKWRMNK